MNKFLYLKKNIIRKHFSVNLNLAFKQELKIPSVTIVRDIEHAKKTVKILKQLKNRFHAWDTETLGINPKEQSPVGNGKVICFSCFAGPDVDFGNGPRLFIDNYAECQGIVNVYKEYFEDNNYLKVWHNYGFDRHILYNHGINVVGFGGDTMHMARLYDTSRLPSEFSLSKLTELYYDDLMEVRNHYLRYFRKIFENDKHKLVQFDDYEKYNEGVLKKIDMKMLFSYKKILKNGDEGKSWVMPDLEELHTSPKSIKEWIKYSVIDAEVTYYLRDALQLKLQTLSAETLGHTNPISSKCSNNYHIYLNFWRPFGELLTDMERNGIYIDVNYLKNIQANAETDYKLHENKFTQWIRMVQPDALEFNPASTQQLTQLLFAPCYRPKTKELLESKKKKKIENDEDIDDFKEVNGMIEVLPPERKFKVENIFKFIKPGSDRPLKFREMTIKGLGLTPLGFTELGMPSCDQNTIKELLVKQSNGKSYAYNEFISRYKDEKLALNFEEALQSYENFKSIETLLKTFILPLQQAADKNGRIHCSLNFNTDTGRISSRKPNLQNQPAYDKDIYKIRYAFQAEKGNKLIVADYGQLELRILANITECKSMIEAFKLGGDFHSRTALGMFSEIQEAIDKGECLLEWDSSKGKPPVPLLKDKFSSLRKKAKTMNFSIAYGKSAHGFSKDWNCSLEEAEESLRKWYSARQEVEVWQEKVKIIAIKKAFTQTLIGRYRNLRNLISDKKNFSHALRAAINTPIQGGAADVVVAAMVNLHNNKRLKELDFKILLQIHDEIILEGPENNVKEAFEIVKNSMENPFKYEFPVKLEVDAKIGNNWYECK